jgi:hypothetical protein
LAKTVTPGVGPLTVPSGAGRTAQWFLPGDFSRKAGPIKHQLVFEVLAYRISAQKPVAVRRGNDIYRPVIASAFY